MYEIINEFGLPNDVGFDFSFAHLNELFLSEKEYLKTKENINKHLESVKKNYGLDDSLNFSFRTMLSLLSYDGKKYISLNTNMIIMSIYEYFNEEVNFNDLCHIYFNQKDRDKFIKEETDVLKIFLRKKIKELEMVKTLDDLKKVSVKLYNSYIMANSTFNNPILFIQEKNNDIKKFKRLCIWLDKFISDATKPLDESIFEGINKDKVKLFLATQYLGISPYLKEPTRTILIDLSKKYVDSIENRNVVIDNLCISEIQIEEDKYNLKFRVLEKFEVDSYYKELQRFIDIDPNIKIGLEKISGFDSNYLKSIEFDQATEYIENMINEAISLSIQDGAKDVELESKLNELQNKINSDKLTVEQMKKIKTQIERLNMVLREIKPDKIQEGAGKFKGFYVYYYKQSGMVAIDKVDNFAGMYIMPIDVYISILKNPNYNQDFLTDIRKKVNGVTFISHGRKSWLEDAKEAIYSKKISVDEEQKYDEVSSINFSYSLDKLSELEKQYNDNIDVLCENDKVKKDEKEITPDKEDVSNEIIKSNVLSFVKNSKSLRDLGKLEKDFIKNKEKLEQLKEKYSNNKEMLYELEKKCNEIDEILSEIRKKKSEIKEHAKTIDNEIKSQKNEADLKTSEREEIYEDEMDLLSQAILNQNFDYLYQLAKRKKYKSKRNPAVSLETKLRTKDNHGFLHCDFCGGWGNNESMYGTNKSVRMFETHHIVPISEGGADNIYNTACLCPGCHTRIHNYLRLRKKINKGYKVQEEDLGEYMTMAEYGQFLSNVRNRIALSTPEYLPYFDELFVPNYNISLSEQEKYYEENKEQEDLKFGIDWNAQRRI